MNISNGTVSSIMDIIFTYGFIVAIIVFLFGLALNIILVYLFITDKYFAQIMYRLMLISAFSDIFSIINQVVLYTTPIFDAVDYDQGSVVCKITLSASNISINVSIYNLCLIALDRYFIILHPHSQFYGIYKYRIMVISEIIIWLISVLSSVFYFHYVDSYPEEATLCDISKIDRAASIFLISKLIIAYIIPSMFIAVIYMRIIRYQNRYVRPGLATDEDENNQILKTRKVTKKLIYITLGFILFTWPSFTTVTYMAITQKTGLEIRNENPLQFLLAFLSIMATFSIVLVTPLLYLKFDENIRIRAWRLLKLQNVISLMRCRTNIAINIAER